MTWTYPWALFLLIFPLGGILGHVALFRWKDRLWKEAGDPAPLSRLLDPKIRRQQWIKALLTWLGVTLVILALAGPRWGQNFQEVHRRGVDVMIAVDLSTSMLAEDVKPNRLTQAKRELGLFIQQLEGDRVGLVAFAGTAFLQCPLTLDYAAARSLLDLLTVDLIPKSGTNIAAALDTAREAFPPTSGRSKALVLLTDGEDHSGRLEEAIERAAKDGLRVFPIGFGSPEGEIIPLRDSAGQLLGYKKDKEGKTVLSKMNVSALQSLATKTGGVYFSATQGDVEVGRIQREINKMEKKDLDSRIFGQGENHFRIPLGVGLLLLALEFLWPEVRRHWRRVGKDIRSALGALTLLSAVFLVPRSASCLGRYPKSSEIAPRAQADPKNPKPQFELGLALAAENSFAASAETFESLARRTDIPTPLRAAAHYNAGNDYYRLGKTDQAIEKYKEALRLVPSDPDAKHNLEMAQKLSRQSAQPKPSPGRPQDAKAEEKKGGLSQEDAQRLLEAVAQQEKSARQRPPPKESNSDEDW